MHLESIRLHLGADGRRVSTFPRSPFPCGNYSPSAYSTADFQEKGRLFSEDLDFQPRDKGKSIAMPMHFMFGRVFAFLRSPFLSAKYATSGRLPRQTMSPRTSISEWKMGEKRTVFRLTILKEQFPPLFTSLRKPPLPLITTD
jgi:hypothetical protein